MHCQDSFQRQRNAPVRRGRAVLVGFGLDDAGGHLHITQGDGLRLVGGSEATHKAMQQRASRIREELQRRGLCLDRLTREQYLEVVDLVRALAEPSA